jgi:prepilin-type N-terminal cleavage/methylation domain-containing protein
MKSSCQKKNHAGFTLLEFIVVLVIAAVAGAMFFVYFGTSLTKSVMPVHRLMDSANLQLVMENITADYNRLNKINLRYKWRSNHKYSTGDIVLPSDQVDNRVSRIKNNGRYYICTEAGTSSGVAIPPWTVTLPLDSASEISDGTVRWREYGYIWKENVTYPAGAIVLPMYNNGHFYKGPDVEFTIPLSNEPTWLKESGRTVPQPRESWSWTEAGTILDSNDTTDSFLKDNLKSYLDDTVKTVKYGTGFTVAEAKFIQFKSSPGEPDREVNAGDDETSSERNYLKVTIQNEKSAQVLTTVFTIR